MMRDYVKKGDPADRASRKAEEIARERQIAEEKRRREAAVSPADEDNRDADMDDAEVSAATNASSGPDRD